MILALETSTATGGAALLEDLRLLGSVHFTSQTLHAQRLLPSVEWLLNRAGRSVTQITGVAVAVGPGSFTGLRICLSAAKGLAWANQVPIVGISTLEALALRAASFGGCAFPPPADGCPPAGAATPVCALLDARQSEVYAALFDILPPETPPAPGRPLPLPQLRRRRDDYAGPLTRFLEESITAPTIFAGDAALKYHDQLLAALSDRFLLAPAIRSLPSAEEVAWLGATRLARGDHDDPFLLAPDYLRKSYTQR